MPAFHLDYETTSECPITRGTYRYASDPSTRILMFAIAEDDGEPLIWSFLDPDPEAAAMLQRAIDSGSLIYAHNAQFELAISHYRLLTDVGISAPHIDAWRCTLAMCRRAAAPESLAQASTFFKLDAPKDSIGKVLINIFSDQGKTVKLTDEMGLKQDSTSPILESPIPWGSKMKVSGEDMTVRKAWNLFCDYCRQDVKVEQELHHKISHFELKGDILKSFQFDLRMNFRGVPVNLPALRNAQALVERLQEKMSKKFYTICELAPSQGKKFTAWLRERGYPEDNLKAGTVERILGDPPEGLHPSALRALKIRSYVTFSALSKIPAMINSACEDGRVRGTIQWHAARTGRAGGRIIQPQNFKKSTIGEEAHLCYRMICENWDDNWFEDFWEAPLEAIASSIRHFLQPAEGKLFDADYAGVEARITPWLAGDVNKLDLILQGIDPYKRIAAMVFNIPYDAVEKWQRTIAKPIELGCCFGVGGKGLRTSLANPPYNVKRTRKECNDYVKVYRDNHPETEDAWDGIEEAAKFAIRHPGKTLGACEGKLLFRCGSVAGTPYLTMRLPSGRRLYYPHPEVSPLFKKYDEEEMREEPWKRAQRGYWIDSIVFYGKITGTNKWGRIPTWGSRLFENAVQSIGADLLNKGCVEAEEKGFPICMIVHDQALCETKSTDKGIEDFISAFCTKDGWASDFPLDASGDITPYYLKD